MTVEKFSVIIPTMWRELGVFKRALKGYANHPLVDDIIIINNDVSNTPKWPMLNNDKIQMHNMDTNIFVNPAWNLGVALAKNNKLIIANDDIEFDVKLIDKIHPRITSDAGVHGIITGEAIFNHPESTDYSIDFKEWELGDITHGFGQLMFLHRSNWTVIPPELKIYFGDDIIFQWHLVKGLKNHMIYNIKFNSPMASTTKDTSITMNRLEEERPFYNDWVAYNVLDFNARIKHEYMLAKEMPSDINQHVETLKQYCDKCESVTEFGVRVGVSTRGVLMSNANKIRSYDLYLDPNVRELFITAQRWKDARYEIGNTLEIEIEPTDLLFIDTDHTYGQLRAELERHHSKVKKYIAFHDTHSYGVHVSDPDTNPGLLPAIIEFMRDHPEWEVDYFTTKNNGFTVLKRANSLDLNTKKKILIAVPTNKYVETETMKSIYDLKVPEGYETELQFFYGYQVDQIRNLTAEWGKNYSYLFCVDSDIVLPQDCLVKMLSADKPIISGMYIQRKPGLHILELYKVTATGGMANIDIDELRGYNVVEIGGCGFGCVLINGDVLRAMPYPHFEYKSALDHKDTVSEDIYFCMKARTHGFGVWVDTSITCDHIGQSRFVVSAPRTHLERIAEQDLLPAEHAAYLKTMDVKPKVVYDIGACVLHWTRKAKEAWPDAEYYLFDAAESSQPFFSRSPHKFFIGPLSDEDNKELTFYEDVNNPGGNSYYIENTGHYNESHAVKKVAWTLDRVVKDNNWEWPDLIKMDVQGAELDIIKGSPIAFNHCKDIILEAQHVDYNAGAPKATEVIEYLETLGFKLVSNFCKGDVDGDYHFTRE